MNNEVMESDLNKIFSILNTNDIKIQRFNSKEKIILLSISDKIPHKVLSYIKRLKFIDNIIFTEKPYYLTSRNHKPSDTIINIDGIMIGKGHLTIIAGPCSVESKSQVKEIAFFLKEQGIEIMRGGIFKPRTSPYSFQGLGIKGLEYLKEASEETGLKIITEVLQESDINDIKDTVDIIQIGTRNMYNYPLLKAVGRSHKPVLLKRALSATIDEWLLSAEYIMLEGNSKIILCERGIRTFNQYMRNTLDISAIPYLKSISHLPIITDPSHSTGNHEYVPALAKASIASGSDGVMIEVHPKPEESLSDSEQALTFKSFSTLSQTLSKIFDIINK